MEYIIIQEEQSLLDSSSKSMIYSFRKRKIRQSTSGEVKQSDW